MKDLEIKKLEKINGGNDFVDGFCLTVGATGLFGWTVPGLNVAKGFCVGWKAAELLS